jgi:hypothetical protein
MRCQGTTFPKSRGRPGTAAWESPSHEAEKGLMEGTAISIGWVLLGANDADSSRSMPWPPPRLVQPARDQRKK